LSCRVEVGVRMSEPVPGERELLAMDGWRLFPPGDFAASQAEGAEDGLRGDLGSNPSSI